MKSLTKLLALAGIAAAFVATSASASPITLSFNVTGFGSYSVDTGDIAAGTTKKTIPADERVGSTTDPIALALAGITLGDSAVFSTLTFDTTNGLFLFTMKVGNLTFTFTSITQVAITPSGANTTGSINQQFNGSVTGDTGVGTPFLGQTASLSEACTQTKSGASIACSDSVITPGLPLFTPEPMPLALLGIGLAGLAFTRRKQS